MHRPGYHTGKRPPKPHLRGAGAPQVPPQRSKRPHDHKAQPVAPRPPADRGRQRGQKAPVFGTRQRNIRKGSDPAPRSQAAPMGPAGEQVNRPALQPPYPEKPPAPVAQPAAMELQTLYARGHATAGLELADQLFELSYVVAVKERAWRRLSMVAMAVGLAGGWCLAHLFSPSLDLPGLSVRTVAPAESVPEKPGGGQGPLQRANCTILQLDRKTGRTTSAPCKS